MATQQSNSTIGEFSGAVGTVVLSRWLDLVTMRSKPLRRKNKSTSAKVLQQNQVFGLVNILFGTAKKAIRIGYQKPKAAKMTSYNAAVSYHLKNAVCGDPEDPSLDLSKIKLSCPVRQTQSVWNPLLSLEKGKNVVISWELNPFPQRCTELDDQVILVCYSKNDGKFFQLQDSGQRSSLSYTHDINNWENGHELHYYLFMVSADGKLVSETEYLGMVTL